MIIIGLIGCGGSSNDAPDEPVVTAITITPSNNELVQGQSLQLEAKASYSDNTSKVVTSEGHWQTNNGEIASITNGLLLAVAEGQTSITFTYSEMTGQSNVTVIRPSVKADVTLTNTNEQLKIRWQSTFDNESGYRIELNQNDTWNTVAQHGSITEGFYGELTLANTSGSYRILAEFSHQDPVLLSSTKGTSAFEYSKEQAQELKIILPATSPYQGIVDVKLSHDVLSSEWFIDSNKAYGKVTENVLALETARYTDGQHRLDVRAEITPDVFVYLNQAIEIYNPNLTVSMVLKDNLPEPDSDKLRILVRPTSKGSVTQVNYLIDGVEISSQTQENPIEIEECDRFGCSTVTYPYHYDWIKEYGEHTIKVTVQDSDNEYKEIEKVTVINNAPVLNITSPLSHELITSNTLNVTGNVENENDTVTTTVLFGDVQIGKKMGTGSFSYEYDLAGLPEKDYQVVIIAEDEFNKKTTNQITFKYAPSLDFVSRVYVIPTDQSVVEINQHQLLSKGVQFNYQVKDLSLPTQKAREINFEYKPQTYMYYPHVNNEGYFSSDYGLNMFLNKTGITQNLTDLITEGNGNGFHSSFMNKMLIQLPSNGSYFYIWDSDSVTYEPLAPPAGTSRWLNWRFTNNDEWLCQSAPLGLAYDVYIYQFGSQVLPQKLTENSGSGSGNQGFGSFCSGNDSEYVFYITQPQNTEVASLHSFNILTGITTNIATGLVNSSSSAMYKDGVLAWSDKANNVVNIKDVYTDDTISITDANLSKVRFGMVSYSTSDGLFIWNKNTGKSTKVWTTAVTHYLSTDSVYMVSGQFVYKANLD
jgi:hypothetical protein